MSETTETTGAASAAPVYDIRAILNALPHRYPLLLVDRVKSLEIGERIHAVKAVTFNEQFFQGHFPGRPIMPGVLQIEALAQTAAILAIETLELAGSGKLVYFMSIDEAKFRAPVEPGVLLDLEVGFVQKRARVCKFWGKASIEGKVTCEVQFTAMVADPPSS
ncbi:3-hydroxyacyl-ACP dehydratase FabZ [Novosphingobium sp.]|jgi:3-hydroxyacyl-[acyl-carrier-protein] dehydratase|uniref:3-hydroxyacyl-ACP dehydratase FabZ n=1 Tax=Novosphingobium sp. TaxID=1874826 RepID=UPI0022C35F43|nr:3-hydroxyacyl-ACP dehydratase FabZ [Novosphingobium sp.]MCZ8017630.1 3-hydroxyacyl-ACP dehydratase FabZ [Novosphingobium sp.]MCZ8033846.1 3-hydroxyacyl-ACP dehydratase FabZ [Novosphingobium sp.]MCZ8051202.1 3-hydroxyacyl-ACP dehydratase FabZ [Novosphingobium sp.]MCZ8059548.1 3-hydroxyacyl-ACP dehydratase FabZ [Novosphingobium sp.]MCZ8231386.1 3-hydroxyacyl-ACP dehydratase FabZ [Novosphingobium sp.]